MNIQLPFLSVLQPDTITRSAWVIRIVAADGSETIATEPAELSDLTPNCKLEAQCRISFDGKAVAGECGLGVGSLLQLNGLISTGAGRFGAIRRCLVQKQLETREIFDSRIELKVDVRDLNTRVHFDLELVLLNRSEPSSALAASEKGSRLWSDRYSAALGGARQFPMAVVSFNSEFPKPLERSAPWRLYVAGNPDLDFQSAVTLFLNGDNKELMERVENADDVTLNTIMADAAFLLIQHVARSESDLSSDNPYSLKGVCGAWCQQIFGVTNCSDINDFLDTDPVRARALVAGWAN
ncbi:hypothetical protein V0U79_08950 [Hyphobacterium sp. HN65]|uniref:Uncharacterized protein n=1 Tax=Hyphobacterium lacteum TaxID=3116575 RepID=A0ABU7LRG5_9PROT|nr:hypothetical protein [Hyphobacterium sp. HN65]MEE2526492.1 hypothetical protein [Hyphobacterium sp. HN65]